MAPTQPGARKTGPRRRGRPPKGTRGDTRQDLLDAALRLFARQGYAATTVRQIADEVDVRDSAIYAHFNAKEELRDALLKESSRQFLDRLDFEFADVASRPPGDALPELFDAVIEEWGKPRNRQLISMLTREGMAGADEGMEYLRKRLLGPFRTWVAEGELRMDLPIDLLLWELTVPLSAVRTLHLNAQSTTADRRRGQQLARRHVAYFLTTAAP